jgi:N-acetylglucosamine kinase-like BadF-type ATPase
MMKLIADSGSTKTDWTLLTEGGDQRCRISTQGINPVHQPSAVIRKVLADELLPQLPADIPSLDVFFYGAGCSGAYADTLSADLKAVLSGSVAQLTVHVASDLLAAARALCGRSEGIACILGTGANSCLYDGCDIVGNIPPLGYILGDEGSGAVLGRRFINALYKEELPHSLLQEFLSETALTYADIIDRVYRQPLANRFLASLSTFIHAHLEVEGVRALVVDNFRDFLRKNVAKYRRPELPVHAIGSIAFCYREELQEAVRCEGLTLGTVLKSPMEGLLTYHAKGDKSIDN